MHSRSAPLAALAILFGAFFSAGTAEAVSYILEVHEPIGGDLFQRYVYVCPDCTVAQHQAVTPPTGSVLQRPAQALYSSGSVVRPADSRSRR